MKRDSMLETLRKFSGQENVLVVPKAFVNFTDSLEAAMMLSQLLYWSERNHGRAAIYKTDADWKDELSLTRYGVRQARTKLEEMGLIKTEIHRANGSPTVHYYLQEDAIEKQWKVWIQTMESAKTDNRKSEIAQSLTEITSENTTERGAKPAPSPSEEKTAEQQFDELPSQSTGMVRQEHTAATASPHIEKRQFVREIAPICAQIMGRSQPIGEDTRTAKKIFEKHLPRDRVYERLNAYRNGEGAEFRKPEAIADWIVGRLERDLAQRVTIAVSPPPADGYGYYRKLA